MKTTLLFSLSLFLSLGLSSQTISKDAVSSAGNHYNNGSLSIQLSWTLGQTVVGTFYSDAMGLYLEQGFQTGAINTGIGIHESNHIGHFEVYPNPFTDKLHLEMKKENHNQLQIRIVDNFGRIIKTDKLQSQSVLNLENLTPGLYHLQVIDKNRNVIQTKIIKQ